jgi:hypothetical protein
MNFIFRVSNKFFMSCAIANSLFIVPTNFYYGCKQIKEDVMETKIYADNAYDRVGFFIFIGFGSFCSHAFALAAKSSFYFILGPIGTHRIILAYKNYVKTNDYGWINVLMKPYSSMHSENDKYIMAPFGKASWIGREEN